MYFQTWFFFSHCQWKNDSLTRKTENSISKLHTLSPPFFSWTLQSRTGKYRGLQGNPCNENRIPAMRTGFPVMKTGFSLWELTYREFPVSLTGFGFAVLWQMKVAGKILWKLLFIYYFVIQYRNRQNSFVNLSLQ